MNVYATQLTLRSYAARVKAEFLRSFAADLRNVGLRASARAVGHRFYFSATELPTEPRALLRLAMRLQRSQIPDTEHFAEGIRAKYGETLLRPTPVENVDEIHPVLHLCSEDEAFRLFTYCRISQGVPNAPLIGRRMAWLVFDGDNSDRRLIGAFGLNSSPYTLGPRDVLLHWVGAAGEGRKKIGLRCIMDMPLCVALPPYSNLLGGKLVAALALTREVSSAFTGRYARNSPRGAGLLGVFTLCATGLHCPIFNRIMLKPGGLYQRIGVTAGFSTAFISDATLALARGVVNRAGHGPRKRLFAKSMRIVKRAFELCHLPGAQLLRMGVRKGVYMGVADLRAIEMLRISQFGAVGRPTVEDVVRYWRELVQRRLNKARPQVQTGQLTGVVS